MKTEQESSDSGEKSDKRSDSSQELCRISIRCSVPDSCTSQEENTKSKAESVSPPIIVEEVSQDSRLNSEDDAMKSDDNNSQKSFDVFETSTNKPLSPSSSINSQRKLEWDSLADVGYANESDRKTSASSLSTLERLALKQQYSNNDTQQSNLGPPTAHSTPLDDNESRSKSKKGIGKKSTKIYKKDVDFVEVNVPHSSNTNPTQSINVNLTKQISFSVEKDGKVTVENVKKDVSVSPEKKSVETNNNQGMDKEIQTSLIKTKDSSVSSSMPVALQSQNQRIPILISLNTLRNRTRKNKFRKARRKLKTKNRTKKENNASQERSGEQLSEAESFEYMPGHIYNQNKITANEQHSANVAGNKSSLESSAALTTDSSKGSKHSFTKDLEKSINLMKNALQNRFDDAHFKRKLIKQICQRLLKSRYRDDDSTTDFLSGLSFSSKKLGLDNRNHTTTSTSDANNSAENCKRPKKSILRVDKFNPGAIASTSQSAPNLPVASTSDKFVTSYLTKAFLSSNTDSDMSSKEKTSSDNAFPKTSSDVLYQKYLQALKREEAYKRHLKDKEMFLKQKLVSSDSAFKVPTRVEVKPNNRLKELITDLTRNNYDDGSGDASKLEGGPASNRDFDRFLPNRNQRSHSVFTLSSGNSDSHKKPNLKKRLQCDIKDLSKDRHYCCCPHHSGTGKIDVVDSSVQVNINNPCSDSTCPARHVSPRCKHVPDSPTINITRVSAELKPADTQYECHCKTHDMCKVKPDVPDKISIPKCPQYKPHNQPIDKCNNMSACNNQNCASTSKGLSYEQNIKANSNIKRVTKSSQTNMLLKMLRRKSSDLSLPSSVGKTSCQDGTDRNYVEDAIPSRTESLIYEATRCIQTEISIDPRIAEPTLSDINIVNECECVKLVSENCRKPCKSSLNDIFISHTDAETCTNSESVKSSGTSNNDVDEFEDNNFQNNDSTKQQNRIDMPNKNNTENFSIPIQGTNMTLMVSIGSERNTISKNIQEIITEGIALPGATNTVPVIGKVTSLVEKCSKRDQTNTDVIDHNSNCKVKTCTTVEPTSSTYPKTNSCNELKGVTRSYSMYNFGKVCGIQTDYSNSKDAETQETIPIETQTSNTQIKPKDPKTKYPNEKTRNERVSNFEEKSETSSTKSKMCSCGCSDSEQTCKAKCKNNLENSNKSCNVKKLSKDSKCSMESLAQYNRGMENHKDILKEKCNCGCGANRDNCLLRECLNHCVPVEQCRKQSQEKRSQGVQSDTIEKSTKTCTCGCDGTIENCRVDCVQHSLTLTEQYSKQSPVNKDSLQLLDEKCLYVENKDDDVENCSCGCSGKKNNCIDSCIEHKLTPREQLSDQNIEKKPCTQNTISNELEEKCSCGCDGIKDNCNIDCVNNNIGTTTIGLPDTQCTKPAKVKKMCGPYDAPDKQSYSYICSCGCDGIKDKCVKDCIGSKISSKDQFQILSPASFRTCNKKEVGTQKDLSTIEKLSQNDSAESQSSKKISESVTKNYTQYAELNENKVNKRDEQTDDNMKSHNNRKCVSEVEHIDSGSDPILNLIQDITRRYSKRDSEKSKRKKCFTDIVLALNYLLETDDCIDGGAKALQSLAAPNDPGSSVKKTSSNLCERSSKELVDKAVQLPRKQSKTRTCVTQSSELPTSTDIPGTSSDSATCKVLNKIKKECEKYHQKRCKIHTGKKCEASSSTSVNCDRCRRVHHCACRSHKCKGHKKCIEKAPKVPIAYNLILQTSESVISEGTVCGDKNRQLQSIVVKVPKKKPVENIPFKEMAAKFERNMHSSSPKNIKSCRSRSLPNESEVSSMDEIMRKSHGCTVREYLEKNRPDFVERCAQRQNCLKYISESRANERAVQRDLLSMHLAQLPDVTSLASEDLRRLASELGRYMRKKQPAPKFISEREMKKHSEKIYKSLPEVVQKKEDIKKQTIKKTNLLMANMFKKNLQKKTLRGTVNISNYSTVIKI